MFKNFMFLCFCIVTFSMCNKKEQNIKNTAIKKPTMSVAVKHKKPHQLEVSNQEKINSWKEYTDINEFLVRFESISPSQALNNALELKDLSKKLKDSLKLDNLKNTSLKARLNVLENEVLRLADMADIAAITPKEVNLQVDKIFLVFGSLNAKINAHYKQKKLEKELDLDNFLKLDSSEVRKPKQLELKKDLIRKNE